jgi:hypothetical protein
MLHPDTPIIFADGTEVYKEFSERYITHSRGFFILAPSGSGKTYYIDSQKEKHWIDGDELWMATNAHPDNAWWTAGDAAPSLREIDFRSDLITLQAKKLGFWVMGASNLWLKPDAVVLPDWEKHKEYIASREKNNYDGGATTGKLQQVIEHRERIKKHTESEMPGFRRLDFDTSRVPQFKSVAEAAEYLASLT